MAKPTVLSVKLLSLLSHYYRVNAALE